MNEQDFLAYLTNPMQYCMDKSRAEILLAYGHIFHRVTWAKTGDSYSLNLYSCDLTAIQQMNGAIKHIIEDHLTNSNKYSIEDSDIALNKYDSPTHPSEYIRTYYVTYDISR